MASPATFIPGSTFKSGKSIIAISRVFHEESVPSALLTSAPPGSTSASEDKDKSVVYEAGNGGGDPNHIADARLYELVMYIETRVEIRDCTADQREQVEDVLAEYRQLICEFVSKTSWTEAAKEFAESVTRLSEALNIALNNTLFGWRLRRKYRFSKISTLWNSNLISISQRMPALWQSTTVLTWGYLSGVSTNRMKKV
jgi:hypothetical protein